MGLKASDSCLENARDDEPLFVLKANDRCAPGTVRDWCQRAIAMGVPPESPKIQGALDTAVAMERWRESNGGGKVPD